MNKETSEEDMQEAGHLAQILYAEIIKHKKNIAGSAVNCLLFDLCTNFEKPLEVLEGIYTITKQALEKSKYE